MQNAPRYVRCFEDDESSSRSQDAERLCEYESAQVDTNVLVRYLVRDDQVQYEKARRLIDREANKGEPVLVSLLVLLETEWVLRSRYEFAKADLIAALSALLDTTDLVVEDEPSVENAIYSWKDSTVDFSDCLMGARNRRLGCRLTATFDRRAQKLGGFVSAG
jgi:predicted nucleic-acid-binding protein